MMDDFIGMTQQTSIIKMSLMIRKDECNTGTRIKQFQDIHKQFNFKGKSAVKCIMLRIFIDNYRH